MTVTPMEPGMKITFQGPISPDQDGIAFELAVPADIGRPDLDARLDIVAGAHRRQSAIKELPLVKQQLATNIEALKSAEIDRARHNAQMSVKVERMQRGRREAVEANPQDVNSLAQHDRVIAQKVEQIALCRARIPYLEAIIRGEQPPELYPESANDRLEAAE